MIFSLNIIQNNRFSFCLLLSLQPALLFAGNLNSPAALDSLDSAMYNLEDIYNRLDTGASATPLTGTFTEPTAGPSSTGHNINEIMSKAPVMDETLGADPEFVTGGKTYWGLSKDNWGLQTGTMPNIGAQNITPKTTDITISEGYHDGKGKVAGDSDLISANLKAGINIFGVSGKTEVVDTVSGTAKAAEILNGKKAWVDGVELTGSLTTQTIKNTTDAILAGNYAAINLSSVDTDLKTANIKAGVTIFGIAGKTEVVDTTSGNALAGEILTGKKAWVDGVEITGSLTTQTLSNANDTVTAGNYVGTTLSAVDLDLHSDNIKAGKTIFGISGKTEVVDTTSGDAVAGELLMGKKAWVDGIEITGSLTTQTLSNANDTVTAGNYAGTTLSAVDTDLATANIKAGITVFGITGKTEVVDTTSGDAVAADMLSGKVAWVDGLEVTGTIATQTLSDTNSTVAAGFYAATNLSTIDADLISANIKSGVTLYGVPGKVEVVDTAGATATAADICLGKTAYVNGLLVTGTKAGC
jgi:fructose-specific component phosphotransferase system IIB-like protein